MVRLRNAFISCAVALAVLAACSSNGNSTTPPVVKPPPAVANTFTAGITPVSNLSEAVQGPDGRAWFTEFSGNKLAAITTAGVVTEYPMGPGTQPLGIIVGPDGNIWTGGYGPGIRKVTTAGVVTTYPLPGSHIAQLTIGVDNNIWFGDYGNNTYGKITTAGVITSYAMPDGDEACGIASGGDGNLWVTDCIAGAILKVSTAGALLSTYSAGLTTKNESFILAAQDGNLYFTEPAFSSSTSDHVDRITTAGVITQLQALAPQTYPNIITLGKDGNLYFTEVDKPNLGRIVLLGGVVTETPLMLAGPGTQGIVNGSDNRLWIGGGSQIYAVTY